MSAALKIAVIVATILAVVSAETPVAKEKEKRGSEKDSISSPTYQQQQQRLVQQAVVQPSAGQHNFQYIQSQPVQQKQQAIVTTQYPQQQLQYVYKEAPGQKQGAAVATQYVQPQYQYVYQQPAADPKAIAGAQYVQQQAVYPQAAIPQAYLGGQYYVHPGQASVLGAQYAAHPGASFYAPQQPVYQQYYAPQPHAMFYYGGLPANYQPYLGNQQAYFGHQQAYQYPAQQLLSYSGKNVDPRGAEALTYVQPFAGAQLPQNYALAASAGVADGHASAQAQDSSALNSAVSSGKYSTKTGSERHQG